MSLIDLIDELKTSTYLRLGRAWRIRDRHKADGRSGH